MREICEEYESILQDVNAETGIWSCKVNIEIIFLNNKDNFESPCDKM